MNTKRILILTALAGLCARTASANPAEYWAARGLTDPAVITNPVAAAARDTLTAPVTYSPRTTLVKTGAGELVLPASAFRVGSPARVQIAEGKAIYTNDLADYVAPVPATLSDAVKAKLVFWGSVKDTAHLALNGTAIERIYDVREADTNAPQYVYLAAEHFLSAPAPTLQTAVFEHNFHTVTNARTMAYFGGYGSGISMQFLKADGTAYTQRPHETAAVYGQPYDPVSFGFLFGTCSVTDAKILWNEGDALPWQEVWGPVSGDAAVWCDRTRLDRETRRGLPRGFHVLQSRYNTLTADNTAESLNDLENALFSIRSGTKTDSASGYTNKGGQYVGEILFFATRLTDVERDEVATYLAAKWNLTTPEPPRLELAQGTTLEVTAAANTTNTANLLATGAGLLVKKGAGTLQLRSEAREATTPITLDLQEGDLTAGTAVTLQVPAGCRITATPHDAVNNSGVRITTAATTANTLEKTGNGYAAIAGIPAGTRHVRITAGTLGIRSPAATPQRYEVAIPNGDFADWGTYTGRGNVGVSAVGGAWSAGNAGFYNYDNWLSEGGGAYYGTKVTIAAFGFDTYPPLDGRNVLMLKECDTWAEVQIPFAEGGEYELRFLLAGRKGSTHSRLRMALRQSGSEVTEIGTTYLATYNVWTPQAFHFRVGTAGTYAIRFHHLPWLKADGKTQQDFTLLINGLHLYRTGDGGAGWKIPFGDCETTNIAEIATSITYLTGKDTLPGWTFDTTIADDYSRSRAGLATYYTYTEQGRRYGTAFNASHAPFARDRIICIRRDAGWAEATFTPPAGRWYLRADSAAYGKAPTRANQLLAHAVLGTATNDLGALTLPNDWQMQARTWPQPFTADGHTPVTLRVTAACESGWHGAYLDNFELVAEELAAAAELVINGDFESPTFGSSSNLPARTSWTGFRTGAKDTSGTGPREYGRNDSDAFGNDHGSGICFFENYCKNTSSSAGMYQDITFPQAGLYRLTYLTKGRINYANKAPCFAYLIDVAQSVTNRLDYFYENTRGTFQQRTALFHIPGPCTRRLLFLMAGATQTSYVIYDDISIRRVREAAVPTFGTAANGRLSITVAANAKLNLDYVGTNVVSRFAAEGVDYNWGVVDQFNCPAITGSGALRVEPKGLHIFFR